jgi:hypothetical protein
MKRTSVPDVKNARSPQRLGIFAINLSNQPLVVWPAGLAPECPQDVDSGLPPGVWAIFGVT